MRLAVPVRRVAKVGGVVFFSLVVLFSASWLLRRSAEKPPESVGPAGSSEIAALIKSVGDQAVSIGRLIEAVAGNGKVTQKSNDLLETLVREIKKPSAAEDCKTSASASATVAPSSLPATAEVQKCPKDLLDHPFWGPRCKP